MTETGGLHYVHERIDKLVHQTALEIGLIRGHSTDGSQAAVETEIKLSQQRFWAAQDAAADNHNQKHRDR